jgi:F-type H+-transporting ATPase subunit gamma
MSREPELRRRLRALEALADAVGAMKSLSAHHLREARAGVEPSRAYRAGLTELLPRVGAALPPGDGPAGLLVVGSDLGLCGAYNAQVAAAGAERRIALGPGPTRCVGQRTAALLRRRGVALERVWPAPTHPRGLPALLLELAEEVAGGYLRQRLSALEVVAAPFAGVGRVQPAAVRLLPLEVARAGPPPAPGYGDAGRLAAAAAREALYATLHGVLLDALAAEHGARLVATQGAEKWLDERTAQVRRALASTRREASTQETIEIAAGARARGRH